MRFSAVTTRYVEALFQLALEQGALDRVAADVSTLAAEIADDQVARFLADARVTNVEKIARLEPLLATLDGRLANFCRLLFEKGRGEVLNETGEAFRLRHLEHNGTTEGRVMSARPLAAAQIEELATAMGRRLGKTVVLKNEVAADLVGGVRVLVDNRMIDNSVQGRLNGLNRKLREVRLGAG